MPFLLPAGEKYTSNHACILLVYPDLPEYRRALLGAYVDLGNAWNWEGTREEQADARRAWLEAIDEGLECADMTCLDELIAEVQAVKAAIYATACCDPNEPTSSPEGVDIYPHEGPAPLPPAGGDFETDPYPVTPATDPDEDTIVTESDWREYACGAADLLIDSLIDWLRYTDFAISLGYSALLIIDDFVKRLAGQVLPGFLDDLAIWTLPSYTEIILDLYNDLTSEAIQLAIADIEAVRDDLRCAIVDNNTRDLAVSAFVAILNSNIDDAVVMALLTTGPISAIASLIWNGIFDADYLGDCVCVVEPDLTWDWGTSQEGNAGWTRYGGMGITSSALEATNAGENAQLTIAIPAGVSTFRLVLRVAHATSGGLTASVNADHLTGGHNSSVQEGHSLPLGPPDNGTFVDKEFTFDVSAFAGSNRTFRISRGASFGFFVRWASGEGYFS